MEKPKICSKSQIFVRNLKKLKAQELDFRHKGPVLTVKLRTKKPDESHLNARPYQSNTFTELFLFCTDSISLRKIWDQQTV